MGLLGGMQSLMGMGNSSQSDAAYKPIGNGYIDNLYIDLEKGKIPKAELEHRAIRMQLDKKIDYPTLKKFREDLKGSGDTGGSWLGSLFGS